MCRVNCCFPLKHDSITDTNYHFWEPFVLLEPASENGDSNAPLKVPAYVTGCWVFSLQHQQTLSLHWMSCCFWEDVSRCRDCRCRKLSHPWPASPWTSCKNKQGNAQVFERAVEKKREEGEVRFLLPEDVCVMYKGKLSQDLMGWDKILSD